MLRPLVLLVLLAALAAPGRALAAGCQAPAGTGAVDEYCETVPDDKGDTGAGAPGSPDRSGGSPITDSTARSLAARGRQGERLARVLGKDPATLPPKRGDGRDGARQPTTRRPATPDVPSSNPFAAVTRAVSGDATIGSSFFVALLAIVLLVLGTAWLGWRRRSS